MPGFFSNIDDINLAGADGHGTDTAGNDIFRAHKSADQKVLQLRRRWATNAIDTFPELRRIELQAQVLHQFSSSFPFDNLLGVGGASYSIQALLVSQRITILDIETALDVFDQIILGNILGRRLQSQIGIDQRGLDSATFRRTTMGTHFFLSAFIPGSQGRGCLARGYIVNHHPIFDQREILGLDAFRIPTNGCIGAGS